MSQQTAVEWLVEKITKHHDKDFNIFYRAEIEEAKEMEKNQKQKDWDEGFESGSKSHEDVPLRISRTITLPSKMNYEK